MSLTRHTPLWRTGSLERHTPLRRSGPITRSTPLTTAEIAKARGTYPERFWSEARAKVDREGRCRVCGTPAGPGVRLHAAHTIGREHDRPKPHPEITDYEGPLWVDPLDVVPLCAEHHRAYDARALDLLPHLTTAEQSAAVRHVGIVAALRRLTSSRRDPS